MGKICLHCRRWKGLRCGLLQPRCHHLRRLPGQIQTRHTIPHLGNRHPGSAEQPAHGICARPFPDLCGNGAERPVQHHVFRHRCRSDLRQPEAGRARRTVSFRGRQPLPDRHAGQRARLPCQHTAAVSAVFRLLSGECAVQQHFHTGHAPAEGTCGHRGTSRPEFPFPARAAGPVRAAGAGQCRRPARLPAGGKNSSLPMRSSLSPAI